MTVSSPGDFPWHYAIGQHFDEMGCDKIMHITGV
jgi:hypothetical protein